MVVRVVTGESSENDLTCARWSESEEDWMESDFQRHGNIYVNGLQCGRHPWL